MPGPPAGATGRLRGGPPRDQRERLRRRLEGTRAGLFEAIAGLTEEQMRRRPAPDCWSVAEVMAHLPVWERQMLRRAITLWDGADQTVAAFPSEADFESAADRGRKLPPPAIVHDLVAARWNTLSFLEKLSAREVARRGREREGGGITVAGILAAIAEYEEEQSARIWKLRDELGLPNSGARAAVGARRRPV